MASFPNPLVTKVVQHAWLNGTIEFIAPDADVEDNDPMANTYEASDHTLE